MIVAYIGSFNKWINNSRAVKLVLKSNSQQQSSKQNYNLFHSVCTAVCVVFWIIF